MSISQTDGLGRATFHHIKPQPGVRPTERELRWLKHIKRHGPQSSEFLFELSRDTHRCKDTALRGMQKLRAGGFLMLPRQQRRTERAEFNPYIYDLTKRSKDHLAGLGIAEATVRPTRHWWHGYTISDFTSSLDILARRQGRKYIPGDEILRRNSADLAIPVGNRKVIPDQLFAVEYEDGYRAFLLEVDRGTEPVRSSMARKSLAQSVDLYSEMFATDAHRRHYGLKATTLVLWVFTDPGRREIFNKLVRKRASQFARHFLCKCLATDLNWQGLMDLHQAPWRTGDDRDVVGL